MNKNALNILVSTLLIINSNIVYSASCEEYPYADGMTVGHLEKPIVMG